MLVTSSQLSTQRPLGLSVEELFALDHQYRQFEQQQYIAQLQAQKHIPPTNLDRLTSRSLDLISTSSSPFITLPSNEVNTYEYANRSQPSTSSFSNYPRSHSIDQLSYVLSPSLSQSKHTYTPKATLNDIEHQSYQTKHKTYLPSPVLSNGNPSLSMEYSDNRGFCKLRRRQPIKRESSRRILVRPVVQRRREPSTSSSCESLDETRLFNHRLPIQSNVTDTSVQFLPFKALIDGPVENSTRYQPTHESLLSDDGDNNLYEMRIPIGKTYDTSDISVQLEGSKILVHCHTTEPTDKRGNYRKHELKTELVIPDTVDDETIVSYLTEDGYLIVEGKYHLWAWEEMKKTRTSIQQDKLNTSTSSINKKSSPTKENKTNMESEMKLNTWKNHNERAIKNVVNRIESFDDNRTIIHVGDSIPSTQNTNARSVSDIINRFNTLNNSTSTNIWDGQYSFTNTYPSTLIYHLRLPFQTVLDQVRVQPDPQLNLLKIFIEQQERNVLEDTQRNKIIVRSTSRLCRLPRDHRYDYTNLKIHILNNNFIRIELPTLI